MLKLLRSWRRRRAERPSLVVVGGTDLDLLRARVKSLTYERDASRLREQELLEEVIALSRALAESDYQAERLRERLALLENTMSTKGRA